MGENDVILVVAGKNCIDGVVCLVGRAFDRSDFTVKKSLYCFVSSVDGIVDDVACFFFNVLVFYHALTGKNSEVVAVKVILRDVAVYCFLVGSELEFAFIFLIAASRKNR